MEKNLKYKILEVFERKIHNSRNLKNKKKLKFTTRNISDYIIGGYPVSVAREIRWFRQEGLLHLKLLDKIKGEYELLSNNKNYNEKILLNIIFHAKEVVLSKSKKSKNDEILNLLHDKANRILH